MAGRIPFDILDGIQIQRRAMRGFIIGRAALGMIVGQLTFSSLLVRALSAVLGFPIRLIKKAVKKIGRKRRQKRIEKEQEIQ